MQNIEADAVLYFLFNFLQKRMDQQALDTFIRQGLKAKGSKSVHGVMVMLNELNEKAKRKQPILVR